MAIDYQSLMARRIPDVVQDCTRRDTIPYAFGIGLGTDPLDPGQLSYVSSSMPAGWIFTQRNSRGEKTWIWD